MALSATQTGHATITIHEVKSIAIEAEEVNVNALLQAPISTGPAPGPVIEHPITKDAAENAEETK